MTTIIVNHENNQIDEHDFASEINTITIGRRSTNDVCIPNLSVSGMHAKIVISDDGAMIEDLGSTNGTYINGRLISRQLLNDGDDIVMGKTRVTFLQPSQNKANAAPVILDDDELPDERPLTLAEKAKLHKSDLRPPVPQQPVQQPSYQPSQQPSQQPAQRASRPTGQPAGQPDRVAAQQSAISDPQTEVLSPSPVAARQDAPVNTDAVSLANTPPPATRPTAGLDDAVINGFEQAETDSSMSHAETMHSASQPDHDMVTLDSDSATASASAVIEIKNGAKSGQVLPIDKPVTTLGRPGIQIAAIMKKPEGYFLMHIESDDNIAPPQLNKSSIGDEPVLLKSGDALNVAGIDVQFMQS